MENLTHSSLVQLAETVDQTIFEHVKPGIGLVTVSVRFKRGWQGGFGSTYEVYTHIAGREQKFLEQQVMLLFLPDI